MNILQFILGTLLITFLGLLVAFSPMIIVMSIVIVLKSTKPVLRTIVLMLGMILPLMLIAFLGSMFIVPNSQITFRNLSEAINVPPLIDLIFGIWLIVVSLKRWRYTKLHGVPKTTFNLVKVQPPKQLSALFIFAFVKSMLSVTNLFAVLMLTKYIIVNSIHQPYAALAILWLIIVGLLPLILILYFYITREEKLETIRIRVDKILSRNFDFTITLIIFAAGVYFTIQALPKILTN